MDDIGMLQLETSKDLYTKLKYDFNKLTKEENSYNYYNFILDANHLIDWIEKDITLTKNTIVKAKEIRRLDSFKLFNDMANRGKHFIRKKDCRGISKDEVIPGFSYAHIDFSKINYGGPIFIVEHKGKEVNLYEQCEKIFNFYKQIFE